MRSLPHVVLGKRWSGYYTLPLQADQILEAKEAAAEGVVIIGHKATGTVARTRFDEMTGYDPVAGVLKAVKLID